MSDEELRRLERIYQQDSSETNLMALNRHRIRVGVDPLRPDPNFLLDWANSIYLLVGAEKSTKRGVDTSFSGQISAKNRNKAIDINLVCRIATHQDGEPREPYLVIELIWFRTLSHVLNNLRPGWLLRATLWGNQIVLEFQGKEPPHNVGDATINKFLSAEELVEFLKGVYIQEINSGLKRMMKTKIVLDDKKHFLTIIDFAQKIGRERALFSKKNILVRETIKKDWFREALQNFATIAEKYLRRFNLNFDLEQTWPTTVTFDGQYYVLTIETGYNDVVDPEDFDESNPEGTRHGFACEMADHFGEGLDKLTGGSGEWGWNSEWEYEEPYEEGSEDIAISVKAEIPLSSELLLQIFGIHRYHGRPNN